MPNPTPKPGPYTIKTMEKALRAIRSGTYRQLASGPDPNATYFQFGPVSVYYSYNTPIAVIYTNAQGVLIRVKSENHWSQTTGKHLKALDNVTQFTKVNNIAEYLVDAFLTTIAQTTNEVF